MAAGCPVPSTTPPPGWARAARGSARVAHARARSGGAARPRAPGGGRGGSALPAWAERYHIAPGRSVSTARSQRERGPGEEGSCYRASMDEPGDGDDALLGGVGGQRLAWAEVPAELQREVERRLGSRVSEAASQPGGFSPGLAS